MGMEPCPRNQHYPFFCHSYHSVPQYSWADLNLLGISSAEKSEQLKSEGILVEEFCRELRDEAARQKKPRSQG